MDDWSGWLPLAEFSYNNRVSSSTRKSPFFVTKGREVNTGLNPSSKPTTLETVENFATRMRAVREETQAVL